MSYDFYQVAYVTNDFDRAVDEIRRAHDMGPFKEMRELHLPTAEDREAIGHFGIAFKGAMQFEVIEPLAGDAALYQDYLASDDFELHFHHLGQHIASEAAYKSTLEHMQKRWSAPINMAGFGGFYCYIDARNTHGHYLEFFCLPGSAFPTDVPRY